MKLALHRSIIFWSGIVVMGFICWAWRDSLRYWTTTGRPQRVQSHAACCIVARQTAGFIISGEWWQVQRFRTLPPDQHLAMEVFPAPRFIRGKGLGPLRHIHLRVSAGETHLYDRAEGLRKAAAESAAKDRAIATVLEQRARKMDWRPVTDWELQLPYWLILLSTALPWSAGLLWRARRRKRAMP